MTPPAAVNLGARIAEFLQLPTDEPDWPEQKRAAKSLLDDLLATLPPESNDLAWKTTLQAVVRPTADALRHNPVAWAPAVQRAAHWLANAHTTEEHPRRDPKRGRIRQAGEQTWHFVVPVQLHVHLLQALLVSSAEDSRIAFFERLGDWQVGQAVASLLPELHLSPRELAALLGSADHLTRGDAARSFLLGPVSDWTLAHPEVARDVVNAWSKDVDWATCLTLDSLRMLVELAVRGGGQDLHWRDAIVEELSHSNEVERWGIAAHLLCFAWPDPPPPTEERHSLLRKTVMRLPERLLGFGLGAMGREANRFPEAALQTAQDLLEAAAARPLAPREERLETEADRACALATIAHRASWAIRRDKRDPEPLVGVLPALRPVPPDRTSELDGVLGELVKDRAEAVFGFLRDWLRAHAGPLRVEYVELETLFPLLVDSLGADEETRWLLRLLVDAHGETRLTAAALLGRRHRPTPIPDEALIRLTATQARAVAYEAVGSGMQASVAIPLLYQLGRLRADALSTALTLLLEDGLAEYPGTCRDELPAWSEPVATPGAPDATELARAKGRLTSALEQRRLVAELRGSWPEMRSSCAAARPWNEVETRVLRNIGDEAQPFGRTSLLSLLATRVPIARGEASDFGQPGQGPTRFGRFEFAMEAPRRDAIDPVGGRLARLARRKQAAHLLNASGEVPR